jgi:hypothetical protein
MEKVDILFFIHFESGMETVLVRDIELSYMECFEKRVKEAGCTETITWSAFDKKKNIVKSGVINPPKEDK